MTTPRELWMLVETVHAVTYFGEETRQSPPELGLDGFWIGYFGFRAAPLGAVGPGTVDAAFANFAPGFVRRWVPEVWRRASPEQLVEARSRLAAATLRRLAPSVEEAAPEVGPLLATMAGAGTATGRPLYAANRDVPAPDDPVEALWQACTTLREHRGDGHVAALVAAGLSGLDAHLLLLAEASATQPERDGGATAGEEGLRRARGFDEAAWAAGRAELVGRGLLTPDGRVTADGVATRAEVERRTDALAAEPLAAVAPADLATVADRLAAPARELSRSGLYPYPNPIGLPRLD